MAFFDKLKKSGGAGEYTSVFAPAAGTLVPMKLIQDDVFSEGILGECCGIEAERGEIFSPIDGNITQVSETRHAVGIEGGGVEVLIHVGIDTVDMNGDGFEVNVEAGGKVRSGDLIIKADLDKIKKAGHPTTVVTVITNSSDFSGVDVTQKTKLDVGDELFKIRK
ncbi:MAG: PTS glucose transporter subunit IIA [Ruminococcaceae bacterium]|nr:PTS glucose transporter subunit IIA [Oscillospiraceae bacterium]